MLLAYAAHIEQRDGPVEQHLVEFGVPPVDAQDQGQHIVRGGEPGHGGGRHQRHGAEPVFALAVPGNGVLGVLLVLHRAAVASPRVPRPDGQGFVAERGGEGRGVLHLFAVNDRPREALGVHPPVPHVIGADGGEIRGHTATAGSSPCPRRTRTCSGARPWRSDAREEGCWKFFSSRGFLPVAVPAVHRLDPNVGILAILTPTELSRHSSDSGAAWSQEYHYHRRLLYPRTRLVPTPCSNSPVRLHQLGTKWCGK